MESSRLEKLDGRSRCASNLDNPSVHRSTLGILTHSLCGPGLWVDDVGKIICLVSAMSAAACASSYARALLFAAATYVAVRIALVVASILPSFTAVASPFEPAWFGAITGQVLTACLFGSLAFWISSNPRLARGFSRRSRVVGAIAASLIVVSVFYLIALQQQKSTSFAAGRLNALFTWADQKCIDPMPQQVLKRLQREQFKDPMAYADGTVAGLSEIEQAKRVMGHSGACDLLVEPYRQLARETQAEVEDSAKAKATVKAPPLPVPDQVAGPDPLKWTPAPKMPVNPDDEALRQELRALEKQ